MIWLTDEERDRFAAWLEQEAASESGLLEQMEKMRLPDIATKMRKLEIQSYRIIAKRLRTTETVTIGTTK